MNALIETIQPALIKAKQVITLLGIKNSHFYSLIGQGKFGPERIRLGRSVMYRWQEVMDWIEAGLPPYARWQSMKTLKRKAKQ